jgi:ParB-like chromosome segregation protein Spo0J
MENKKEFRTLNELTPWNDNPRTITREDFKRLKRQIQRLGIYKPLLITEDGTILGGNARYQAYKDLGYKEVWVSVVDAPTEAKKLEYALSDNEQFSSYEEEDLADLLIHADEDIPIEDYKITIKDISLEKLLKQFGPGDEFSSEETKEKKKKVCPKCGYEFP